MNNRPKRPGFYVEERYFGNNEAQAKAFAKHRSEIFGRLVKVTHLRSSRDKCPDWIADFWPTKAVA